MYLCGSSDTTSAMDAEMSVDSMPFNHPIYEDFHLTSWPYDHAHGIHVWDPTISHRHWETHPAFHFLNKQTWIPTKDTDPFDAYLINGNVMRIPKYTKQGDRWVIPRTSELLAEKKDQANFAYYRRWRFQDLNNQRYTYRNKYPPLEWFSSLKY